MLNSRDDVFTRLKGQHDFMKFPNLNYLTLGKYHKTAMINISTIHWNEIAKNPEI